MNADESNGQGLEDQYDRQVSVMVVDDDPIFLQTITTSFIRWVNNSRVQCS